MSSKKPKLLFVADEMGTPGMAYGTNNTYVFGGYVVAEDELDRAVSAWRQIETKLCDDSDAELKCKHFFVDYNDSNIPIPLLAKKAKVRRHQAAQVLKFLFGQSSINPAMAVSRKDRATQALITKSRKGKDKIDDDLIWLGPVAQVALFPDLHQAVGQLWFDSLGNLSNWT